MQNKNCYYEFCTVRNFYRNFPKHVNGVLLCKKGGHNLTHITCTFYAKDLIKFQTKFLLNVLSGTLTRTFSSRRFLICIFIL